MSTVADSSKVIRYTLEDISSIVKNGFHIELPEETLSKISIISAQVGSPTYVRTPDFAKVKTSDSLEDNTKKKRRPRHGNSEHFSEESWDSIRHFETTKIGGSNSLEASVRRTLNMLTDKNVAEIEKSLLELIPEDFTELDSLCNIIFDVASGNIFFSSCYATIFSALHKKFSTMDEILTQSFGDYIEQFSSLKHVDAKEDYEKFCRQNKDIEKRKALSSFYLNLWLSGVLPVEKILEILQILFNLVFTFTNQENKKNEVDEISENIGILLVKEIADLEQFHTMQIDKFSVLDFMELIANSKPKQMKSLTSKTVFKFMDFQEFYN